MAIHLARYQTDGTANWGVVLEDGLAPLAGSYDSTADLIANAAADMRSAAMKSARIAVDAVQLLSPVSTPCRVLCQGANYRQHVIESGMDPDKRSFNLFFDKTDAAVTGPAAPVARPRHVHLLDYEIELALVIGAHIDRPISVTPENLHEYVFGITIANDLSARDVQLPQGQFLKGKSYRGFCPIGPFLAVPEPAEFDLLDNLDLRLEVNGQPRQQDNTANMLYRPAETLTELTEFCNLSPGDVLLTGTPHGCVATSPPALVRRLATALLPEDKLWASFITMNKRKSYLKPGDVINASIRSADGALDLGVQRTIITEPSCERGVQ